MTQDLISLLTEKEELMIADFFDIRPCFNSCENTIILEGVTSENLINTKNKIEKFLKECSPAKGNYDFFLNGNCFRYLGYEFQEDFLIINYVFFRAPLLN
jgi:hypothetical protein